MRSSIIKKKVFLIKFHLPFHATGVILMFLGMVMVLFLSGCYRDGDGEPINNDFEQRKSHAEHGKPGAAL